MSKKIISLHAYDCLDNVNYTARVREYADYEQGNSEVVLIHTGSFRGEGVDDVRQWVMDVLIGIIETL